MTISWTNPEGHAINSVQEATEFGRKSNKEMDKALDDDMDKLKSKPGKVWRSGTVDLTNARMTVYYDPRNWDESKMSSASKP